MAAGFGQSPSPFQGQTASVMEQPGVRPLVAPVAPTIDGTTQARTASSRRRRPPGPPSGPRTTRYEEAQTEVKRLDALRRRIHAALDAHGLADDVAMAIDERGLRISLVSRHIVFHGDVADLTAARQAGARRGRPGAARRCPTASTSTATPTR